MPEVTVAPPAPVVVDAETTALHLKISHAFKIFDQDNSNQVDARYGCYAHFPMTISVKLELLSDP
jgi:hypothetical protein